MCLEFGLALFTCLALSLNKAKPKQGVTARSNFGLALFVRPAPSLHRA